MTKSQKPMEDFGSREYFYVGGEYVEDKNGEFFKQGQMYVEKLTPADAGERSGAQQWPVVFIHGNGQSGTVSWWLSYYSRGFRLTTYSSF